MKEILEELRKKVNERVSTNEKYRKKLEKAQKSFCIVFDGSASYNFSLRDGKFSEIREGETEADIRIEVSSEDFRKLLSRELDPMTAYIEKKIKVRASLMDKLLLTELFK